ncbi:dickkopf-related protein 2 isoform X2 [Callorhinchus milii]|nr:dickkopf-related protein 2 isoform X2 [Callorhinchus milii]
MRQNENSSTCKMMQWKQVGLYVLLALVLSSGWAAEGKAVNRNSIRKQENERLPSSSQGRESQEQTSDNHAADNQACAADGDCATETYCSRSHPRRQNCHSCKTQNKRCHRDRMCCSGNRCIDGICIIELQISKVIKRVPQRLVYEADDDLDIILGNKNRSNTRTSPSATKGLEGDPCLRSSDCLSGFCCSRHLWSKMCKPLLQEDEVCTKHRRKGARVLEIYERCNCEKGLTCQTLQDPGAAIKARLSTCQKH